MCLINKHKFRYVHVSEMNHAPFDHNYSFFNFNVRMRFGQPASNYSICIHIY
jgi:hypothetical protein